MSGKKHQNTESWWLKISSTPMVSMLSNFTTDEIKGLDDGKKIPSSFELVMTKIWPFENEKKWYEFFYEKGTLRETIKLVESSIDRKVYVPRLRKTMLRMSYAHIVSLYHIIWVIRSLFSSFQSYFNNFFYIFLII